MEKHLEKLSSLELLELKSKYKTDTEINSHYHNSNRLQHYLEKTPIKNISFLYQCLKCMPGNDRKGPLTKEKLILFNDQALKLTIDSDINDESSLFNVLFRYKHYDISHPILRAGLILELEEKSSMLAYLDEFFKDYDNCIDYQGTYMTFCYVKNYLAKVLDEDSPKKDDELVYQDYPKKIEIVTENIASIAKEILKLTNQVPGSRFSICNRALSRISMKKPGSFITMQQQNLIDAIAYGTTLEKLKDKNYEEVKQLIYVPYQ